MKASDREDLRQVLVAYFGDQGLKTGVRELVGVAAAADAIEQILRAYDDAYPERRKAYLEYFERQKTLLAARPAFMSTRELSMRVVYSQEDIPAGGPAIFLAGPTPRARHVASWRPAALGELQQTGFTGIVLSPELREQEPQDYCFEYPKQIAWERSALRRATVVLFWVPRDLRDMPAFTTNIEFGFVSERKQPFVLGFPLDALKMRYMEAVAHELAAPVRNSLAETVAAAVQMVHHIIGADSGPERA